MVDLNPRVRVHALAEAQHHLFLDQPLEFVALLRQELNDLSQFA
jgi:hypothetical protein